MKLVCISDTHRQHSQLDMPEGDVLIHSGDALSAGNLEEFWAFSEWMNKQPYKHKIYVPGNHDGHVQNDLAYCRSQMPTTTILVDQPLEIEGFKFYGSPWTPTFFDWWYMQSETELDTTFAKIPEGLDVLITHGPPLYTLDEVRRGNVGSHSLARHVQRARPKHHIFGHIHESYGKTYSLGTASYNVSSCDGGYRPVNAPVVIDLTK